MPFATLFEVFANDSLEGQKDDNHDEGIDFETPRVELDLSLEERSMKAKAS